jgi:hypothetical protein
MQYELQHGAQAAGTVSARVLSKIVELSPKPLRYSAETGSGKTTVLLSHLADHHLCFTYDDRGKPRGSLDFVQDCPLFRPDKTTFVLGPTQRTLPSYKFSHMIDLALIDGAHGYPFPEMDLLFFYPHVRAGALLIVDDINIPTIRRLAEFLCEHEMFEQIHVEGNTAFFRRTTAETFDPEAAGTHEDGAGCSENPSISDSMPWLGFQSHASSRRCSQAMLAFASSKLLRLNRGVSGTTPIGCSACSASVSLAAVYASSKANAMPWHAYPEPAPD